MLSDDTVFEFLTRSENLPVALEVANYVDRLKKSLHEQFWVISNSQIKFQLEVSEYKSKWKYKTDLRGNAYRERYGNNRFEPILAQGSKQPHLYMFFGHTNEERHFQLYWGVHWSKKPEDYDHSALITLTSELVRRNMKSQWSRSVRFGYMDRAIYSPEFLINMFNQPDEWVGEISNDVWRLFLDIQPLLETINEDMTNT